MRQFLLRWLIVPATLTVAAFLLPVTAGSVSPSATVVTLPTALVQPVDEYSAVWANGGAYIFGGGEPALTANIQRFQPTVGATTLAVTLPAPLSNSAAVWTGSVAYIFGGSEHPRQVLRFDPTAPSVTLLPISLPEDVVMTGAVWTGSVALVASPQSIIRFDPQAMSASVVAALPEAMGEGAAAWSGSSMYILGGFTRDVAEFDPTSGAMSVHANVLPHQWHMGAASWDGQTLFIVGGLTSTDIPAVGTGRTDVLAVDVQTWTSSTVAHMPAVRVQMAALFDGGCSIYIAGGDEYPNEAKATIFRFGSECPAPPPVADFAWQAEAVGCTSATFRFYDTSTPGAVSGWSWDFGDATTATGPSVEHTFTVDGAHTVTMSATMASNPVSVTHAASFVFRSPCPPALDAIPRMTVNAGEAVHVCPLGHAGAGGVLSYEADGLPRGAAFDANGPCLDWTPQASQRGNLPCIRFTVLESPSGLSAWTCLLIVVVDPEAPVVDSDLDGIPDASDNCAAIANRDQDDRDGDGVGDACQGAACAADPAEGCVSRGGGGLQGYGPGGGDQDLDNVADGQDDCPSVPDAEQVDTDGDRVGDACDLDVDGDGVLEAGVAGLFLDNCPTVANQDQSDSDSDGVGDACDPSISVAAAPGGSPGPAIAPTKASPSSHVALILATVLLAALVRPSRDSPVDRVR